jgi:hypothetical protein
LGFSGQSTDENEAKEARTEALVALFVFLTRSDLCSLGAEGLVHDFKLSLHSPFHSCIPFLKVLSNADFM